MALGLKLGAKPARVYCILGDGEIQEGQVWEAAMSAPKLGAPDHHLDNLCVILDYNGIQLDDFVKKILDLEPVVDKWQAFGWPVIEIDGHDLAQIDKALDQAEAPSGKPTLHRGPHRQGQGRVLHGEQSRVARQGPQARGSGRGHPRDPRDREAPRAATRPAWAAPILHELAALEKK